MDSWEELLLWIVIQGGSFHTNESGAWLLDLDEDDPYAPAVAIPRRPADQFELAQLLGALTRLGLAWPPPWSGRLN
ncbi:hypothetical protein [Phytohabitans houttuyneae]|uniref:Uncharacterized protein n=1 Tax=Phytohabitans houttuyneae TaxID=1076126 RepID=A0A6V8K7F8_9ACTN|nr:hypothetical protein [Phytohabitans houttuyneae]GFJ79460.1 hypothetical protein Phou_036400 [Phytohabitans houttuyneae]